MGYEAVWVWAIRYKGVHCISVLHGENQKAIIMYPHTLRGQGSLPYSLRHPSADALVHPILWWPVETSLLLIDDHWIWSLSPRLSTLSVNRIQSALSRSVLYTFCHECRAYSTVISSGWRLVFKLRLHSWSQDLGCYARFQKVCEAHYSERMATKIGIWPYMNVRNISSKFCYNIVM